MTRPTPRWRRGWSWAAPSLLAGFVAAPIAGVVEAIADGARGVAAVVASAGFSSLLAAPVLAAAALAVRGTWLAWRPRALAARIVDERGGAPGLAGWLLFGLLAAIGLGWSTFHAVRVLAWNSAFKPNVVALVMPMVTVACTAVLAAVSLPVATLLGRGLAAIDRRAHRRFGRSLMTPRLLLIGTLAAVTGLMVLTWLVGISPRIGHLETGLVLDPLVGGVACAALHPVASRWRGRRAIGAAALAPIVAAIAVAQWVRVSDPALLLEIWSRPTVAGFAIDRIHDLETVRADLDLSVYRPAERPGAPHPDIVLITIDTVRADRTPLNGGVAKMPNLVELGAKGTVFEWAFAPGNVTRRSIPTLATGLSPTRIRGRVAGWALRLDPRHVTLAERLRAAGYDTAGFFCCPSFWGPQHRLGINRGIDHLYFNASGEVLAGAARRFLEERARTGADKPLFVWIHFLEPHNWTTTDRGSFGDADRKRLYDQSLAEVDRFLGDLTAALQSRPTEAQPIIAVTADHGEGLGDHGAPYHSSDLYNSQLRVPLVLAGPMVKPQRINEVVSVIDLPSTLLDLAGFVPPGLPDMDGRSLGELATGVKPPDLARGHAFAAMIQDRSVPFSARAIVSGRWKLIESRGNHELYDLRTDPNELRDVARSNPEALRELRRLLEERSRTDRISPFR